MAPAIAIRSAEGPTILERFAHAAIGGYEPHPGAPTADDTMARLDSDHPTRRRCTMRLFVAEQGGAEARVAAIVNPRLRDDGDRPIGLLGFFEAHDDELVAESVLASACAWLADNGCAVARGPMDFTTWHPYRFVTAGADAGWFPGEPYHHAYYVRQWQSSGFRPVTHYSSNWLGDPVELAERFAPRAAEARAAGFRVRTLAADGSDLDALFELSSAAFAGAFMFSPIDRDEFGALYPPARAALAASTSYVALSPDGEPAGFMYNFESPLPLERRSPVEICKTVAVAPGYRDQAVYQLLMHTWFHQRAGRGRRDFVGGLMHAEGSPALMGWCRPETRIKEYALYERRL